MSPLRRDILLFPGGKKKAFTLSYDDGITQDERFIELLDKYGIKCTFNINSGLMGQKELITKSGKTITHYKIEKERIADVYKNHEIAVHAVSHADLVNVPQGMVAYEISQCRQELEKITKHPVKGMAYPFGKWDENVIEVAKCCGITYARTVESNKSFDLPKDYLAWHPTCYHIETETMFECLEKFLQPIEKYRAPKVYFLWGHTYEFDMFEQWEVIENFLKKASGRTDIWYATNGQICDYMKAVKCLEYSADGKYIYNPTCTEVWMMISEKAYKIAPGVTVTIE